MQRENRETRGKARPSGESREAERRREISSEYDRYRAAYASRARNGSFQSAGIRHQFCNYFNLCAFQCHSSCHDKTNISGTKDHNFSSRHIAFNIYQSLCCTC